MKTNSLLVSVLVLIVGFACWIVRVTTPDLSPFPDRRGKRVSPTSSVRISAGQRDSGLSTASVYKGSHHSASGSFVGSRGYHHGAGVGMMSMGTASSISSVSMGGSAASSSFTLHTGSSRSVQSIGVGGGSSSTGSATRVGGNRSSSAGNVSGGVSGLGGLTLPTYARNTSSGGTSATAAASSEQQRTTAAGMRSSLYTSRMSQNSGYALSSNSPLSSSLDNLSDLNNLNNLYDIDRQWLLASNSNSGRRKVIHWDDTDGHGKYYDDEEGDYISVEIPAGLYVQTGKDSNGNPIGTPFGTLSASNHPESGRVYYTINGNTTTYYTWNGYSFIANHSEMTPAPVGDGVIVLLLMASAMMAVTYFGRRRKQEAVA